MDLAVCIGGHDGAVQVWVRAQPGAKRSQISGLHGERLKVALAAPPVDGKANAELLRFFAQLLALPRAKVVLASGATSRDKRLDIDAARIFVEQRLEAALGLG